MGERREAEAAHRLQRKRRRALRALLSVYLSCVSCFLANKPKETPACRREPPALTVQQDNLDKSSTIQGSCCCLLFISLIGSYMVNLSRKGVGKPTRGPKNAKSENHTPHTRKTKRSRIWLGLGLGLGFFWKIRHINNLTYY